VNHSHPFQKLPVSPRLFCEKAESKRNPGESGALRDVIFWLKKGVCGSNHLKKTWTYFDF